jgi:hypothetical protein
VRFPAHVKPLTKQEALEFLRREDPIESVSAFAHRIGWERTRASRAVEQWAQAGQVVRRPRAGGPTAVEAVVPVVPHAGEPAQTLVVHAPLTVQHAPARAAHPVAHPAHRALSSILAAIRPASVSAVTLFLVALALGGTGLVTNARYAASLGSSDEAAIVLAVVGMAADILAMVLPSGSRGRLRGSSAGCRGGLLTSAIIRSSR